MERLTRCAIEILGHLLLLLRLLIVGSDHRILMRKDRLVACTWGLGLIDAITTFRKLMDIEISLFASKADKQKT